MDVMERWRAGVHHGDAPVPARSFGDGRHRHGIGNLTAPRVQEAQGCTQGVHIPGWFGGTSLGRENSFGGPGLGVCAEPIDGLRSEKGPRARRRREERLYRAISISTWVATDGRTPSIDEFLAKRRASLPRVGKDHANTHLG